MLKFFTNYINKIKWKNKNVIFDYGSKIDRKSIFEGKNRVAKNAVISRSKIGFGSYIGENSMVKDTIIGRYSSIGPNVNVVIGTHPTNKFVSTHPAFYSTRAQIGFTYVNKTKFKEFIYADEENHSAILIGNDVWIGYGVTIMSGVTIGDGAIIAAGSMVTKDVESYSIYAGIPAKQVRYRFSNDDIEYLKNIQWWNRGENWIKENAEYFEDISKLYSISIED